MNAIIINSPRAPGFTLLELLVVMSIIALLVAMVMPVISLSARASKRSNTQAILARTEAALRQFHTEMRVFPHQAAYPAADPTVPFAARDFANRLAYHLGTAITTANAGKVRADMVAASDAYRYDLVLSSADQTLIDWTSSQATAGPLAITGNNVLWERLGNGNAVHLWGLGDPKVMDGNAKARANNAPVALMVNRMFQERARRAMLGGQVGLTGTAATLPPVNGAFPDRTYSDCAYDRHGDRVVAAPASAACPGWAADYLGSDLEPRFRSGDAILDAWGNPLVYIQQLSPAIDSSPFYQGPGYTTVVPFDTRWYGLRTRPALPADLPLDRTAQHNLDGRIRLSLENCGWGVPTPANAPYLPDPARQLDSDVRYYAAPGFERDFELWSAGADGRFCWRRSDDANRDNLAVRPYQRGLQ